MDEIRDTIPRLKQILPHMLDQLIGMRNGTTFEEMRQRYSATAENLALNDAGRHMTSRVGSKDAFWSTTADVLNEAMRLRFVERELVPSARRYVAAHRERKYFLTLRGQEMADLAENDIAAFCDSLVEAIHATHPAFRILLCKLKDAPIACPEISERDIEAATSQGNGTQYWVDYVDRKLNRDAQEGLCIDKATIQEIIVTTVHRRFGTGPDLNPTGKALAQAINEAFAVVAFTARGLPVGAIDINMLTSWGSQLRVLDESRYVPGYEDTNVVWLAAEVVRGDPEFVRRRDLNSYAFKVAIEVIASYARHASAADTRLLNPYVPIYKVRADAAFRCGVTRGFVDLVIELLSAGKIPNISATVNLHLGTTHQPMSEPLYRRGGNRSYELTIQQSTTTEEN
jgi:hypothetical protein